MFGRKEKKSIEKYQDFLKNGLKLSQMKSNSQIFIDFLNNRLQKMVDQFIDR